jgi:hypothetical protein
MGTSCDVVTPIPDESSDRVPLIDHVQPPTQASPRAALGREMDILGANTQDLE